jgi:hypothetical protein
MLGAEIWDLLSRDSEEDDVYEEQKRASRRFQETVKKDGKKDEKLKEKRMVEAKKWLVRCLRQPERCK